MHVLHLVWPVKGLLRDKVINACRITAFTVMVFLLELTRKLHDVSNVHAGSSRRNHAVVRTRM
jgi:hypothetical protein